MNRRINNRVSLAGCAPVVVAWLACLFPLAASAAVVAKLDFNRDIRPILSDNCYACHGPDEKQRKGNLRLDLQSEAFKPAKSGETALIPGQPDKSPLLARIQTSDEDDLMPPFKTGKKLTSTQKETLRRWIAEGAEYSGHWSFSSPVRPLPPKVSAEEWVRNDIDRFVKARLEKEDLPPTAEADRRSLIRRVTLELTGLPPTPGEVENFVTDQRPDAYDRLVNRLLESPRFGEHMTRYWLDAARYADTHGYHIDSTRSIWKYRDWVVNAYNANMPFDQFTIEQLAGDLLQQPSTAQQVATGYMRCNMSTGEGGAIEEEYQAKYGFDRLETTGTIWLGMTLLCARCHTHKYDPISQKEYYAMFAFLNNLKEDLMDGNKPNPDPFLKLPTQAQSERQAELKKRVADGQAELDAARPELDAGQAPWMQAEHTALAAAFAPAKPATARSTTTNSVTIQILEDGAILASGERPEKDVHELTFHLEPGKLAAIRVDALPHESLPAKAAGRSAQGTFKLSSIEAEWLAQPDPAGDALAKKAEESKENKTPKANSENSDKPDKSDKSEKTPEPKKLKFAEASSDLEKAEADPAIDDNSDTAWGIPADQIAEPHAAVFAFSDVTDINKPAELKLKLRFESGTNGAALGHYRISLARDEKGVQRLSPPKPDSWRSIGPFPAGQDLRAALAKSFPPEEKLDLKAAYPGVRGEIKWAEKSGFADGQLNELVSELHGVHGVYFLHRTLVAPEAGETEIALRADDLFRLWVNGELALERNQAEKAGDDWLTAQVRLKAGTNEFLVKIVNLQGQCRFTFSRDQLPWDPLPSRVAVALAASPKPPGADGREVRGYYHRARSARIRKLDSATRRGREQEGLLDRSIPTTLVAKEMAKSRETTLLMRGEYDKRGEAIEPGIPSLFPPLPAESLSNRLGFAQWLVQPSHPLTARVTVNRLWQQVFGVGLVKTSDDFGVQGEHPSHPELLDWLATEFTRTGWDVKRLMRLFVTSATYRQSSAVRPDLMAHDPENRLLARGPRFRLDAEAIRDAVLAMSGLLADPIGGPTGKPFEPPGLWEAVSFNNSQKYVTDLGANRFRRSLYTHWKRQSPPPAMLLFDAPTREYCVVRRPRTNTPLQALALLNDPQYVEASRAFGQRIVLEGGTDRRAKIEFACQVALGKLPSETETQVLLELFEAQHLEFSRDAEAAKKFLSVGEFALRPSLDAREVAAWAVIASVLFNLDETLTKG